SSPMRASYSSKLDSRPTASPTGPFASHGSGHPTDEPAVAVEQGPDDKVTLYASSNGATEVATWEVLAGPRPGRLESVGAVPRDGFETSMLVQSFDPYVGVRAKDRLGQALGTSAPVKL
ncbi:MAG TPA: hypothetical protein VK902_07645, partial [Rubrobacter sp.]|nr:hypothetical protein [Rubrobacter sp.]